MRLCTEPGCDKKYLARGYCRNHYRAHGLDANYNKPQPRSALCKWCGTEFSKVTSNVARMVSCSEECRRLLIAMSGASDGVWACRVRFLTLACAECGSIFYAKRERLCCSDACAKERGARRAGSRDRSCPSCGAAFPSLYLATYCESCREERARVRRRDASRNAKHVRRVRMKTGRYEPVKSSRVYERDEWTCGICQLPVDRALMYPDPGSPSLDHVIPLARGGSHTYDNVQLAHFVCNWRKSDTMPTEGDAHALA